MKQLLLTIAWLWVAIPLGWGIYQSIQKSMPLFDGVSKAAEAIPKLPTADANR